MKSKYLILIAFVVLTGAAVVVYQWKTKEVSAETNIKAATGKEAVEKPPVVVKYKYGLPVDSFNIEQGRVGRNQPLSLLLSKYGVTNRQIHDIDVKSKGIFDTRKFRTGNSYTAFLDGDSARSLAYLVYEQSPVDYIVFRFRDSLDVWNGTKRIDTVRCTFAGAIETSLWNTMTDHKANPMLAVRLSEIYAWSIDFFGLQKGDSIRVVYDELYVDSTSFGIGKIEGAYFRHMNTDFWAIPFAQDSTMDFFDEQGKSLRKAFLKAPLRYSRISSRFSNSRYHPILKIRRPHHGVDYAAPTGTPVHAIGDGVVINKGYNGGGGNAVKIRHNSIYATSYMHLHGYARGLHKGSYVKQGDIIGYVGSTGLATGPHLDFRVYKYGTAIDPLKMEAPPVEPVLEKNMTRFTEVRNQVMYMVGSFRQESYPGSPLTSSSTTEGK